MTQPVPTPLRPLTLTLLSFALFIGTGGLLGCAGSSVGEALEADPQLAENPPFGLTGETPTPEEAPSPTTESTAATPSPSPSPGTADRSNPDLPTPPLSPAPEEVTKAVLSTVPEDLRGYVEPLLDLNLLEVTPAVSAAPASGGTALSFQANQKITRSDYARWLFMVNNAFYADQPPKRIRAGLASSQPAFQDVPPTHPDFAAIQGLAEAGLIPSALTGNATAVKFRPEDPLTRKDLILWKVPLDTRQILPSATPEAVKEAWGFQDAAQIEALALRAVLADYQNGELANIRRAFGYTTLFQPDKAVTQAEAAAVLWRFGTQTEGISASQILSGSVPSGAPSGDRSRSAPAPDRNSRDLTTGKEAQPQESQSRPPL